MIRLLRGIVVEKGENILTIDIGGVGYGVFVSSHTSVKAVMDQEYVLYVYTHVREQEITLYGFSQIKEREMFELLISVNGIGPKAALNILSISDVATLSVGILNKDVTILTNVSGVGKKTAQKVIIELQGKVDSFMGDDAKAMSVDGNAIEALKSMGYSVGEARAALENVDKEVADPSEKIKLALKSLGR